MTRILDRLEVDRKVRATAHGALHNAKFSHHEVEPGDERRGDRGPRSNPRRAAGRGESASRGSAAQRSHASASRRRRHETRSRARAAHPRPSHDRGRLRVRIRSREDGARGTRRTPSSSAAVALGFMVATLRRGYARETLLRPSAAARHEPREVPAPLARLEQDGRSRRCRLVRPPLSPASACAQACRRDPVDTQAASTWTASRSSHATLSARRHGTSFARIAPHLQTDLLAVSLSTISIASSNLWSGYEHGTRTRPRALGPGARRGRTRRRRQARLARARTHSVSSPTATSCSRTIPGSRRPSRLARSRRS